MGYASEESAKRARESRRLTAEAKHAAFKRLRDLHSEEFRLFYNEECTARGITPLGARRDLTRARLLRELAALDAKEKKP